MALDLDQFYQKEYNEIEYNCSHFVRDVWLYLKGVDISALVGAWNSGNLATAMAQRTDLTRLSEPESPCIGMCANPGDPPHVGIVFDSRSMFHMTPDGPKVHSLDFIKSQYKSVKFYLCLK